jgi:hypothetical protein
MTNALGERYLSPGRYRSAVANMVTNMKCRDGLRQVRGGWEPVDLSLTSFHGFEK